MNSVLPPRVTVASTRRLASRQAPVVRCNRPPKLLYEYGKSNGTKKTICASLKECQSRTALKGADMTFVR